MGRVSDGLNRHRSELLVSALRVLTYLGLAAIFFGLMGIPHAELRHIGRVFASTLITWIAVTGAMTSVYGGYDVGRKKNRPITSSMALGNLITCLVTDLQLRFLSLVGEGEPLVIFDRALGWLAVCVLAQTFFIYGMVRAGNWLYFRLHLPRACLLIHGDASNLTELEEKIGRYRLQWHLRDVAHWSDPDLSERIEQADVVFLAGVPDAERMRLMKICYDLRRDLVCKAGLQDIMLSSAQPLIVDDAPFLEMDYHKITLAQRCVKRLGDIAVSLTVLLLLWPLMGLIALAILTEDGRPVLFQQQRITVGGHTFTIRKFRTMQKGENSAVSEEENDARVTRIGRFLRVSRLDELPQFWNILIGDMTLVGPRPEMLANVEKYKHILPTFVYREKMKAGLTGYAQIEGRYNTSPEDKLMLDLMYIEGFSLWNDVRLLFRTLTVFFKPDSAQPFPRNKA
ncbi:MAG: sugar transferase [Clostridia bacterium]|nr:sugar transferase [Clostridia bacterium]